MSQVHWLADSPVLHPAREQRPMPGAPFQRWNPQPDGKASAMFYRTSAGILIRFPGIADFVLTPSGLDCFPLPGTGEAWQSIYGQQVYPLLLADRGGAVFHGGAVAVEGGAVAFLASSGVGKSTLTTAFARRGYPFLSDDCLHLDLARTRAHVLPHGDHVRLWEDSAAELGEGAAAYVAGSSKPQLAASDRLPHCKRAVPIACAYILAAGGAKATAVQTMTPSQQLLGWTANAFVLDIKNPDVLKRNLAAAARLVREVPMRRLDYPRRYEVLDDVVDAVLADVAG